MEPRRSKHYLARIPTIALLVLFAMSPELSILFFILRAIDRDALKTTSPPPSRRTRKSGTRT